MQKNGGYGLEHSYSTEANATKVFRAAFPAGVGLARNLAQWLLEV